MLTTRELIEKKRDDCVLSNDEIVRFIQGITDESVSDAQIAAFVMAIWFNGMTESEQMSMTRAMRDSGEVLAWPALNGPVLDKHSTGGVGDMVSLMLGPIVAACGAYVPMISGRGLGHTGGTLDKLDSIPGFQTQPAVEDFREMVADIGVAIIGQTDGLVPADRRMYAVRDVTATVASSPLIISSILSKKLAEGLDGLVLDIKTGNGAFMQSREAAEALAGEMSRVSAGAGLPCRALVTNMNQPLAWTAGNALEIGECIDYLADRSRHERLDAVVRELSAELLYLGGIGGSLQEAEARVNDVLDNGSACEVFARMVHRQGGPSNLVDQPHKYLPAAPICRPVHAESTGFVVEMNTLEIGMAVVQLGGGRAVAEDDINPAVGLSGLCSLGDALDAATPIAMVHAANESDFRQAEKDLRAAVRLAAEPVEPEPVIIACYGSEDG